MHSIPKAARPVIEEFAPAFTRPTLIRFTFLLVCRDSHDRATYRHQRSADPGPRVLLAILPAIIGCFRAVVGAVGGWPRHWRR